MGLTPDAINDTASYVVLNGRLPIGFARMGQDAQQAILKSIALFDKLLKISRRAGIGRKLFLFLVVF